MDDPHHVLLAIGPRRTGARLRPTVAPIVLCLVAVGVMWSLTTIAFRDPARVAQLTVQNDTRYDVRVVLDGFPDGGPVGVGAVRQHCAATFRDVLDPGDTWVFHVTAQGEDGGTFTVSREQLEQGGWNAVVPADLGERLTALGAPPPPTRTCS